MPRNSGGLYNLPAGTRAQPNTTIASAPYNAFVDDISADLNTPRPTQAGGTGATSAPAALANLGGVSISVLNDVLLGMVSHFAMSSIPDGWLQADGAAISRATYLPLFELIGTTYGVGNGVTTFNLPDLRGQFIRGLDLSRGLDPARVLGSSQTDDIKSHGHTGTASSAGAHTHKYSYNQIINGNGLAVGTTWAIVTISGVDTSSAGAHTHTVTVDNTGGTESRPKNVALVACIFAGV